MDKVKAEKRFWAKVKKGPRCWEWQGRPNKAGYGVIYVDGKLEYAHRYAFLLLAGDIPRGQSLYNTCSDRLCVNPKHWSTEKPIPIRPLQYKATKKSRDRRIRVTMAEVHAILAISEASTLSQAAIAAKYRISQAQVSRILAGKQRNTPIPNYE